jgi:hypothetical protein
MDNLIEEAISFVMEFYGIDRDVALKLYMDEIESYIWLLNRRNDERTN